MPNLFRMSMGGGGGSEIEPYVVIVTLNENFRGQTVTLTQDGQDTLRKTVPMTEPYEVTFKPMYSGIWLASSITIDGRPSQKNTEPLAEWGTYSVTLESGFNFKEWLIRGGVTETFASFEAVLADQPTVRKLMTVHASCDFLYEGYLVDSTVLDTVMASTYGAKWLGLRDYACDKFMANETAKATMLSSDNWEYILKDKVPVMTANNMPYGTASAFQVFDNNDGTTASGTDFSYEFSAPICVNKFTSSVNGGQLQARNNGSESWKNITAGENHTYYKQYNVHYSSSQTVHTIQFYGRLLNVSVPKMSTNNTTPYGIAYANSEYNDSYRAWKAFDRDTSSLWGTADKATNSWISYDFGFNVLLKHVSILNRTEANYFTTSCVIEGYSEDIGDWDTDKPIKTITNMTQSSQYEVDISTSKPYKKFRVRILTGGTAGQGFREINFYGVDYEESHSERTWIYDNGVELIPITKGLSTTREDDSIYTKAVLSSQAGAYGVYTTSKITIDHKTLRAVLGTRVKGNSANSNILASFGLNNAIPPTLAGNAGSITPMTPLNSPDIGYNVQSFKGQYDIMLTYIHNGSGQMSSEFDLKELWLEQ